MPTLACILALLSAGTIICGLIAAVWFFISRNSSTRQTDDGTTSEDERLNTDDEDA